MARAVAQVLWPQRHLLLPNGGAKPLQARVGSGMATYFKPQRGTDIIVFGRKMVASKCVAHAGQWLSYRELSQYNFFDGYASPLNLLAHTVCHEFAHYIQAHYQQRRHGQVHNVHFYHHLRTLYAQGLAAQVQQYLAQALPALAALRPIASHSSPALVGAEPHQFSVGQHISFYHKGELVQAEVTRVNQKTLSAKPLGHRGKAYWRVPPHLVTRV